ncbi:hypothetical protein PsYK624_033520 [Phanerochaete sordida]|uniref:Uncharacterized protein n=1 Tax=Phanerochaete sordida TaxID=48140 RepID=A0A9P3G3M7_9APHY|nr:hypothetical protein PsYK624_033520 [Phanerochaete sordida]
MRLSPRHGPTSPDPAQQASDSHSRTARAETYVCAIMYAIDVVQLAVSVYWPPDYVRGTHTLSQIATGCLNVLAEEGFAATRSYGTHYGVFGASLAILLNTKRGSPSAAES